MNSLLKAVKIRVRDVTTVEERECSRDIVYSEPSIVVVLGAL